MREVAAEFTNTPDATIDAFIARADRQIDPRVFGPDLTSDAGAYLTAHLLKRAGHGDNSATPTVPGLPIASTSVGAVSVSYAQPGPGAGKGDASLRSTVYGIEYAHLLTLAMPGPIVI